MKKIFSLFLLCSALSMQHTHAYLENLELELGENTKSFNKLRVVVSFTDSVNNVCHINSITRLYTMQGDRLHACPSHNQDETTLSVDAGYTANVRLNYLKNNKEVVLDYSVWKQAPYGELPWPLSFISSTTEVKSGGKRLALNTESQEVMFPNDSDLKLVLSLKAVLEKQTITSDDINND